MLFFNLQEQVHIYKIAHPSVDLRVTSASVGDSLLNDSTCHRAAALQLTQLFINLHHLEEEEKVREAKDVRATSAAESVQFTAFISKQGAVRVTLRLSLCSWMYKESSAPKSSNDSSICCRRPISSLYTFSRFSRYAI